MLQENGRAGQGNAIELKWDWMMNGGWMIEDDISSQEHMPEPVASGMMWI